MDFEKQLHNDLKKAAKNMQPSKELQTRVSASFQAYRQEKMKRRTHMKKRFITAIVAAAVLVPTGVFAGPNLPSLLEKIIGTSEEAKQKTGTSKEGYESLNKSLEVAKQIFTKEELERYTALLKEDFNYMKRISVVENGERHTDMDRYNSLTPEEHKKAEKITSELNVYQEKINASFTYTLEEAQKLAVFPIKRPTYLPAGYVLEETMAKAQATVGTPKPVVVMRYKNGESDKTKSTAEQGFTIVQSDIETTNHDYIVDEIGPFTNSKKFTFHTVTDYTLEGYSISFGKYRSGKIKGMKLVVPEKEGKSAYQVYINSSILSQKELEKVLLSIVKQ